MRDGKRWYLLHRLNNFHRRRWLFSRSDGIEWFVINLILFCDRYKHEIFLPFKPVTSSDFLQSNNIFPPLRNFFSPMKLRENRSLVLISRFNFFQGVNSVLAEEKVKLISVNQKILATLNYFETKKYIFENAYSVWGSLGQYFMSSSNCQLSSFLQTDSQNLEISSVEIHWLFAGKLWKYYILKDHLNHYIRELYTLIIIYIIYVFVFAKPYSLTRYYTKKNYSSIIMDIVKEMKLKWRFVSPITFILSQLQS